MDYINKKNRIDTANTVMYRTLTKHYKASDTDDEKEDAKSIESIKREERMDTHSVSSYSTIDIDTTSVNNDQEISPTQPPIPKHPPKNETPVSPASQNQELVNDIPYLHGNSVKHEILKSPMLQIVDYQQNSLTDHSNVTLQVIKPPLDQKNCNFSVVDGVIKMDSETQNQYYHSYAKVIVSSTSHCCKICNHVTITEAEMTEHITEHSLKQLMKFS
jgi:hypothetical protein